MVNDTEVNTAHYNDTVTLTVTPNTGYAVMSVSVNGEAITPVNDVYSFTMPAENVTISAEFAEEASLFAALQSLIDADTSGTLTLSRDYKAGTLESYISIPYGKSITIDLNGHTIDRGLTKAKNDGYVIKVDGALTLTDSSDNPGTITGGWTDQLYCGGVHVSKSGTFTMNGGTISDNRTGTGGGGGGVCLNSGTFTMNGGTISHNSAKDGGGVYVSDSGTFTMNGGTISDNSGRNGGGVCLGGTFTMTGGTIIGNWSQ